MKVGLLPNIIYVCRFIHIDIYYGPIFCGFVQGVEYDGFLWNECSGLKMTSKSDLWDNTKSDDSDTKSDDTDKKSDDTEKKKLFVRKPFIGKFRVSLDVVM